MKQANVEKSGKWAMVCGASQGIGRAIAEALSRDGYSILALARSLDKLNELKSALNTPCEVLALDISDRKTLEQEVRQKVKSLGGVSVLILNSGGPASGPITEAKPEQFLQAFEQHVLVNSLLSQICIPEMREQKFGRIISILSTSVRIPLANLGVSNTIRGAVASWAKTLSNEVGKFGITVNNILPGYTATARLSQLAEAAAKSRGCSVEDIYADWKKTIPVGRFAEPSEIAEVAAFLASSRAGYVNGVSIPVDGGRTGAI